MKVKWGRGIILLVVIVVAGCTSSASKLTGRWVELNPTRGTLIFEFSKNQTFLLNRDGQEVQGTWLIMEDGRIKATLPGIFGQQYIFGEFEKTKLVLDLGKGKSTTFLKASHGSNAKFGGADLR